MADGDYVYFFIRETAVEYINCGKVKIFKTLANGFIRLYLATDTNFLDFFRRCIHGWPAFARTTRVVRTAGPIVGLRS